MLRAGFTEVPVIGIQTICTNTNVSPIAKPHITGVPFLSSVTPKTTSTKMKVKTISARKAVKAEVVPAYEFAPVIVPAGSTA